MISKEKTLYWCAAIALAMPLTSFRRRLYADSFSVDWQVLLRIIPLGILAIYLFPKAMKLLKQPYINGLLFAWLLFLSIRVLFALFSPLMLNGLLLVYYQMMATVVILGISYQFSSDDQSWLKLLVRYFFVLISVGVAAAIFFPESLWFSEFAQYGDLLLRYSGGLVHPFVISELGCVFIGLSLIEKSRKLKFLYVFIGVGLLLGSITKTWIFAAVLATFALYLMHNKGKIPVIFTTLLFLISTCLLLAVALDLATFRLESLSRSGSVDEVVTFTGRTRIWVAAIDAWMENPIWGSGTSSSSIVLLRYGIPLNHAHNLWFQVLLEGGIILFSSLMYFVFKFFENVLTLLKLGSNDKGVLLCFSGMTMLISSITTLPGLMFVSVNFVLWLTITASIRMPVDTIKFQTHL